MMNSYRLNYISQYLLLLHFGFPQWFLKVIETKGMDSELNL